MIWFYPLPGLFRLWPDAKGEFGYKRRFHCHEGIDLYKPIGSPVFACENGIVVAIIEFTGFGESPHWNDTYAVLVEGPSGVICYGEINPYAPYEDESGIRFPKAVGESVKAGDYLGLVDQVLKVDKGRPMSMLHLELLVPGSRDSVAWPVDKPKPEIFLDPTEKLWEAFMSGGPDIRRMRYREPERL